MLCFGTESGKLLVPRPDAEEIILGPVSEEAINGVAFSGNLVGLSTRSGVVIGDRPIKQGEHFQVKHFDGGAHDIVATANGLLAPLGIDGLLLHTSGANHPYRTKVGQFRPPLNFHKIARLGLDGNAEVFACAARNFGIAAISLDQDEVGASILHPFSELDLIDVCSLRSSQWPLAAVAVGIDRTLLLSRDILNERPGTLRIGGLTGKAYSVLCSHGHLFLLTSNSLVILPDLAKRFLEGQPIDRPMRTISMPIHAVDAFLAYDEIFLILPDKCEHYHISELIGLEDRLHPFSRELMEGSTNPTFDKASWEEPQHPNLTLAQVT